MTTRIAPGSAAIAPPPPEVTCSCLGIIGLSQSLPADRCRTFSRNGSDPPSIRESSGSDRAHGQHLGRQLRRCCE